MYWYRDKNPAPSVYVDAAKTINAPYCQGNVTGFGENGGQRCVAMSLCTLRASLCKILISSFAHKMDFAHNFSVDFF